MKEHMDNYYRWKCLTTRMNYHKTKDKWMPRQKHNHRQENFEGKVGNQIINCFDDAIPRNG